MNIFLATAAAAKPDHSIYNAIFWLLVLLAVFIAALAVKVLFEIADKEIELWRVRRSLRTAIKKNRQDARAANRHKEEK